MAPASDNVWVGDLPQGMDKDTLANLFTPYGTVSECRVMPGKDEISKPCALIRFASVDMATWVVENLNGNIPEGLAEAIICRYANAPGEKGKGGKGDKSSPYGGGWGGKDGGKAAPSVPSDNIWVGDLPIGIAETDLATVFSAYGEIAQSRLLPGNNGGKPAAMIRFASVDMAAWVVENLNGNIPEGLTEPIIVRFANSGGGKGKSGGGGDWQAGGFGGKDAWGGKGGKGAMGGFDGGKGGKGGKGKKGGAPGSFQELFASVKGSGILGGGPVPEECQCYVRNLPPDTTDLDLYKLFAPFGSIPPTGVKAMMNPDGTCKGVGFVDLSDATAAATAVAALNGTQTMDGGMIEVSTKRPSKGGKDKGKGKGKGK